MTLAFGSLFAGIGGFDLGLERAGMRCAWQVEIDARCNEVLVHHWPDVARMGDIRDVGKGNLAPVDVITGGFPCQDLSVAGKRAGLGGERSGLWWQFARIIGELEPRWVVIENVPGLLSSGKGRDMGILLGALAERGYGWAYRVLDAQYFGLAQRRKRVFIVGSARNGRATQVLFESEGSAWDSPPSRKTRQKPTNRITNSIGIDSEHNADYEQIGALRSHQSGGAELFVCLETAHRGANQTGVRRGTSYPVSGTQAVLAFEPRYYTRDNKTGGKPQDKADITNAHKAGDSAPHIAAIYPTLRGQPNQGPGRMADDSAAAGLVRRLMPIECERLQGFPDHWTDVNGMSDSARYRMLGNAVAVPVAEWIGRRIVEAESG